MRVGKPQRIKMRELFLQDDLRTPSFNGDFFGPELQTRRYRGSWTDIYIIDACANTRDSV